MAKVYPVESKKAMSGAEFRHIRRDILKLTQVELMTTIHRGIDRISSWENDRAPIPPLVASHMRILASKTQ